MKCAACPADGPCVVEATRHAPFCRWAEQGMPERLDLIRRWSRERAPAAPPPAPAAAPAVIRVCYRRSRAHHGLGVNAAHTAGCLARPVPSARTEPIDSLGELAATLAGPAGAGTRLVVLQGRWSEDARDLAAVADAHPGVLFLSRIHSNLAFLQIEPTAFAYMRDLVDLARPNLKLSAVSRRLAREFSEVYGPCVWLPNLYDLGVAPAGDAAPPGDDPSGEEPPLRMAQFGAARLQKHATVGAMAALIVAKRLGRPLIFSINVKVEQGGLVDLRMLRSMFAGLDWAELVEVPWAEPATFRSAIRGLDLHFQLSSTETFNITCADLAAAGVPSVVGEGIDWLPADCRAPIDDAAAAAEVGLHLLADPTAGARCRRALEWHQRDAEATWRGWLKSIGLLPSPAPYLDQLAAVAACDYREPIGYDELTGCGCTARCLLRKGWADGTVPLSTCLECVR